MSEAARIKEYEAIEAAENEELLNEEEQIEEVAVLDDASSEYLLHRIAEANEQYDRMASWYKQQTEKAKQIRDRTVAWAERGLRAYLDMVPAKETKTQKKYELPGGTLLLKAQQPKFDVVDAELVPWLKNNGSAEYVKVKEEANWADLKKQIQLTPDGTGVMNSDGEILPGVTVTMRDPVFTATPNTKKN